MSFERYVGAESAAELKSTAVGVGLIFEIGKRDEKKGIVRVGVEGYSENDTE